MNALYSDPSIAVLKYQGDEDVALTKIALNNIGPFEGDPERAEGRFADGTLVPGIEVELHPQVNLFVGPNNSGKSTILEMANILVSSEFGENFRLDDLDQYDDRDLFMAPYSAFSVEWTNRSGSHRLFRFAGHEFPGTSQSGEMDARIVLDGGDYVLGPEAMNNWEHYVNDHGSVGYYNPKLIGPKPNDVKIYLRDGVAVAGIDLGRGDDIELNEVTRRGIQAYLGERYPEADQEPVFVCGAHITAALNAAQSPLAQGVLEQIQAVTSSITGGFTGELGMNFEGPRLVYGGSIEPEFDHRTRDGVIPFERVSQGTTSVIEWVTYVVYHMARHYRCEPGWMGNPGIFIIDEIDAHLHPSWQRRIIPTLRRHFPNVQIFASTHSPLMVAGLGAGQVHLLKRDETGKVIWSRNDQDVVGWSADEIYRTFMGIEDPTDAETADAATELRALRNQGPLEDEQAEEERQSRIVELRKRINRDLLAGGAFQAQRQVFAEQVIDLLERRRQDRDLNQENG